MNKKVISVVVPVFNEVQNVALLYAAVDAVFAKEERYVPEFIFVDDGSSDGSDRTIEELSKKDVHVKMLQFSRNFGQQAATSAGIIHAGGEAVLVMDADLQHPPRLIPEFLRAWEKGAEVVIGVRKPRRDHGFLRRFSGAIFSKIMNSVSEATTQENASDFRLLDRRVADAFKQLTEKQRLTRSLIDWLGFKREYIWFDVEARAAGVTHYSYGKLLSLALSSVIAHSRVPLLIVGMLGGFITFVAGILGLFILVEQLLLNDPLHLGISPVGMLALMILFLNGVVLLFLGLQSLYVLAVREEVLGRPFYVVRRSINMEHV